VLEPNRELRLLLEQCGVDLILHNCGEPMTDMVRQFAAELRPAMLSLGSSRRLWEDAAVVPIDIVLFGNLPTKSFYSDGYAAGRSLAEDGGTGAQHDACGHPHIPGSECDVLHVPGAAGTICRKVATRCWTAGGDRGAPHGCFAQFDAATPALCALRRFSQCGKTWACERPVPPGGEGKRAAKSESAMRRKPLPLENEDYI
jgi:hypothetical protein